MGAVGPITTCQGGQRSLAHHVHHTSLSPSCGPLSGRERSPVPFDSGPGAPKEHCFKTITHGWKSLSGSPGSQHITGERKYHLDTLQRVRGIVRLYLHQSFPKAAQLNAFWTCDFSHGGKWEHVSEITAPLAVLAFFKEVHFYLTTSRAGSYELRDWGKGRGKQQMGSPRALKEWGSFSLCCRIHQELTHEPLGMPGSCTSLQMAHGTLHAPCTLPTKTPILSSSLSTLPTVVRVSFGRRLLSTCRMLAHVCRPGRDHKLEL